MKMNPNVPLDITISPSTPSTNARLENALSFVKGPIWYPLLNKTAEAGFTWVVWRGKEGDDPHATIVYEVRFCQKEGDDILLCRLLDETSAFALSDRLNHLDETVKEITQINFSPFGVDTFELRRQHLGRYYVMRCVMAPK